MPKISGAPSVNTFTTVWTNEFTAAVKRAAGTNGKLSAAEAKKMATRTDGDQMFADSAIALIKARGNKAVDVAALATDAKAYAKRAAEVAAGNDGKLSLADGAKLPKDLVEDFFFLRGEKAPTPPTPGVLTLPQLKSAVEVATQGLTLMSETDANLRFVSANAIGTTAITPHLIRQKLTYQHDRLIDSVMSGGTPLAKRTGSEVRDAQAFLTRLATPNDPSDPASVDQARRFGELKTLLESQLTDMTVVRFGDVNISTFIVGRTKTGELAGILTGQVET
jgi:hypothetical protein